jgi:hypothetical protein
MRYIKRPVFSGFLRKNDGATIIEFAIVAPVFFLIMFGMMEFGLFMYHKVMVDRIAVEVSRVASLGRTFDSGCPADPKKSSKDQRIEYIECIVRERSKILMNGERTLVQIANLTASGGSSVPDICLDDPQNPSSEPTTCTIFEDVDGDGVYKGGANDPGSTNAAGVGDIIEVRISYPWSVLMPLMSVFFEKAALNGVVMISESTIIRNE